ncbi:MAG TPA: AAA family ATPase, partial [Fibrobacteraceae bacterium]|nr:AAA family ATPase [Fibrobacteraceae bacterium]
PDVFNTLLQVLDDGRLTDGKGRVVSFKNTIVLMTSNLGSHLFQEEHQKVSLEQVMPELRRFFRPEFLNRLDETLVFTSLSRDQLHSIVKLKVNALQERLSKQGFLMSVTEEAVAAIAEKSYDPQFGARPIQRYLQRELERVLSHAIIAGEVKTEIPFVVDYKEKTFVIQ